MNTIEDERIGKSVFAINLQALPSQTDVSNTVTLQKKIYSLVPSGLYTCPPHSLHISIFPIIWARGNYSVDPKQYWNDASVSVLSRLSEVTSNKNEICLIAKGIEVFDSAVVLKFEENGLIEELRTSIKTTEELKMLPKSQTTLTHTTLFRFTEVFDVSQLKIRIAEIPVDEINWTISNIELNQEIEYPSLKKAIIKNFRLKKPQS